MIRVEVEFQHNESRLMIRSEYSETEGWRKFGDNDQQLFSQWIDSYRDAMRRQDNHYILLNIGQKIYDWLNGAEGCMERLINSLPGRPLILEFKVSARPSKEELRFLEVPWELMANNNGHLAAEPNLIYCPVRRIGKPKAPEKPSLYRLHTVFMAAAPRGSVSLQYEKEETALLDASGTIGMDLIVEESGTLDLLAERIARETPVDVLHISCHGSIESDEENPTLLLENEEGDSCPTTADYLADKLTGIEPRLLFLSACMTSEPNALLNSLSTSMIGLGMPAVLGWGGPVRDEEATQFAASLYNYLSNRRPLEQALALSRWELIKKDKKKESKKHSDSRLTGFTDSRDWHLARLYLGPKGGGKLSDGQKARRRRGSVAFLDREHNRVRVASDDEFVGRRRQIQEILRGFKKPQHAGVLIHGIGRQGKSSLAARIANRLVDHRVVVIHQRYDALAILEAIEDLASIPGLQNILSGCKEKVRKSPEKLFMVLKEILEGPCRELSKNEDGTVECQPLLLVIDDFEQALTLSFQDGLHRVKNGLVDTMRSVFRAFDASIGITLSRLLITSRYRFTLPYRDHDLAARLLNVHLPPMVEFESRKQMAAKKRVTKIPENSLDSKQVERCIREARGNPGLQDLLFSLCSELPDECDKALNSMDKYIESGQAPSNQKLLEFLEHQKIRELADSLSSAEKELLRVSTLFQAPVPVEILELIAKELGIQGQESLGFRLLGFGIWEPFPDMVDPNIKAVAINAMARPFAGLLSKKETNEFARMVLQDLFKKWGGEERDKRPYEADIELTRLALVVEDSTVLIVTAKDAVRGFEKNYKYKEAAYFAEEAIRILDKDKKPVSATLLRAASEVSKNIGHTENAKNYITRALDILSEGKDKEEYAYALIIYGRILVKIGNPDEALSLFQEAEKLLNPHQFLRERSIILGEIARIKEKRGEVEKALDLYEKERKVYEELRDPQSQAIAIGDIAHIKVKRGKVDEALELYKTQLSIFEDLENPRSIAITRREIARILEKKGKVDEAKKEYWEQIKVFEDLEDPRERAITLGDIANLLFGKGELDEALIYHHTELKIYKDLGDILSQAAVREDIAKITAKKGDYDDALEQYKNVLEEYKRLGYERAQAFVLGAIARILVKKNKLDEASKLQEERLRISENLKDPESKGGALWDLGKIELERKNLQKASEYLNQADRIFSHLEYPSLIYRVRQNLGRLLCLKGEKEEGIKMLERSRDRLEELGQKIYAQQAQAFIDEFKDK